MSNTKNEITENINSQPQIRIQSFNNNNNNQGKKFDKNKQKGFNNFNKFNKNNLKKFNKKWEQIHMIIIVIYQTRK